MEGGHWAWEVQLLGRSDIMAGQHTCLERLDLEWVAAYRVIELVALLLVSSKLGLDGEHPKDSSDCEFEEVWNYRWRVQLRHFINFIKFAWLNYKKYL